MKIRVRDLTRDIPERIEGDLSTYLRQIHLRFANGIHAETRIYTCHTCADGGLPGPHELHWNADDVPGEQLIDEFGWGPNDRTVERVQGDLAAGKAVRLFIFNSDADLCFQEVLDRAPESADQPEQEPDSRDEMRVRPDDPHPEPNVTPRSASPTRSFKGSWALALSSMAVPVAFAIRAFVRLQASNAEQAVSEQELAVVLQQSHARQEQAGQVGAERDTQGCIDWAMSNCHPGDGDCQTCMDALRGCLTTAKVSASTCAEIPRYAATMPPAEEDAAMAWQKAQAEKYGLTHWSCSAMFKFVQLHCHPL